MTSAPELLSAVARGERRCGANRRSFATAHFGANNAEGMGPSARGCNKILEPELMMLFYLIQDCPHVNNIHIIFSSMVLVFGINYLLKKEKLSVTII